jgi:hypothetical protein
MEAVLLRDSPVSSLTHWRACWHSRDANKTTLALAPESDRSDDRNRVLAGTSYSGRRATNAILRAAGSHESPASAVAPYVPPEWEPLRRIDEDRRRAGQPNLFDTGATLAQLTQLLTL